MLRSLAVLTAVVVLTLPLMPVQWLAVRFGHPLQRRIPVLYHRMMCRLLDIRVRVVGKPIDQHPVLIVSNHSSWLDIVVITSLAPVVFIAKREVATWPFFGWLAKLQRSVFVDRERRHKTADVNAEIAQRLASGDPVVLFGEGTSSDGNRVLPFRSALVGAARDALAHAEHTGHVWLQPLSVGYTKLHGLPMGRQMRPIAAWYGKTDLIPHLLRITRLGGIDVTAVWGEPVPYNGATDRKAITRDLEGAVRAGTRAALHGRVPGSRVERQPIVVPTESEVNSQPAPALPYSAIEASSGGGTLAVSPASTGLE
jgi:1-acyl-sn-glycerol-3-phosphate acyltransferase